MSYLTACSFIGSNPGLGVVDRIDGIETIEIATGSKHLFPVGRPAVGSLPATETPDKRSTAPRHCSDSAIVSDRYIVRVVNTYERDPIELLDIQTGETLYMQNPFFRLSGLPTDLTAVAGPREREFFLALSEVEDTRLLAYEIPTGRIWAELQAGEIEDFAIDASGDTLVTLGDEGLLVWKFSPAVWEATAEKLAGRPLSPGERLDYTQ